MASDFLTFIRRTRPRDWTRELLESMSHKQVELLAKLLGTWYSGTKQSIVTNLLEHGALREKLTDYDWPDGDHEAEVREVQRLAAAYKGHELRLLCKVARVYAPGTKYGMAASLLGWRNLCRSNGQRVIEQLDAEIAALPAGQRRLNLQVEDIGVYAPLGPYGDKRTLDQLPANNGKTKPAMFAGAVQLGLFDE